MNIFFNEGLSAGYVSKSQIARVLTESWTRENMYCPVCGASHICSFPTIRLLQIFIALPVIMNLNRKVRMEPSDPKLQMAPIQRLLRESVVTIILISLS